MNPWASVTIALRGLRTNRLRSALTMLGVIIGVASVIAVMAFGAGAQQQVLERIRSLGANLFIVLPGASTEKGARLGSGTGQTLTEDDAEAIRREIPFIASIAPSLNGRGQAVRGNRNWSTKFQGVTPDYFIAREWQVAAGRSFTAEDMKNAAKVAILGQTVAEELFGTDDPIGQKLRLGSVPVTVIGLLERKGPAARGGDQDDRILIPLSTAQIRVLGSSVNKLRSLSYLIVKVSHANLMAEAETQMRGLLRQRHRLRPEKPDDFRLRNMAEVQATREQASGTLTRLLLAVALVALVVGGISIMNIMLVSVTERTREIGLRLAVGARRRDIRNQFLVEAITLSALGGLVGVALGVGGGVAVAEVAGWPILIQVEAILLGFGSAAAVGVFFGFYPAHKAARLDPIGALRFE